LLAAQGAHFRVQIGLALEADADQVRGRFIASQARRDRSRAPADLYTGYPSRHQLPAKVRAFINFLSQQLQPEAATAAESG
jgi:hypothetical protein